MSEDKREYVVSWVTTETVYHVDTVDAETMADMMGVSVEDLAACGYDSRAIERLDGQAPRGLADGLADIEDSDTEDPERSIELDREVRVVVVK